MEGWTIGRLAASAALLCCVSLGAGTAAPGGEAPRFSKPPTAVKAGGGAKIEFAVDRETDVAVFVENAKGEVVRHLVAGVLGPKAPPPLKPGLAQSLEWDGKADWGKAAPAGPFRVRVALGLGAKYDRVLVSEPLAITGASGMAVGPDGTLYAVYAWSNNPVWASQSMAAVNRDGTYQRQIQPYPSNLKTEQVKAFDAFLLDGRPVPLVRGVTQWRDFYPPGDRPQRRTGLAVTPGGVILRLLPGGRIGAVGGDGSGPWVPYAAERLLPNTKATFGPRPFTAVSSDGQWAFVSGLGEGSPEDEKKFTYHAAVYRVKLPDRSPASPFFGDPKQTGSDDSHLGGPPRGLAVDGQGHLLIADQANNRVVVINESDGKLAGSFPVEKPDCLAVDPAGGAVYVNRLADKGTTELVRFSGWKDAKVQARLALPKWGDAAHQYPPLMALDAGARPPVVWMSGAYWTSAWLMRIEDLGGKFGDPRQVNTGKYGGLNFVDLSVERLSKTVYARVGPSWVHYDERGDKLGMLTPTQESNITQLVPGPDGNFFFLHYPKSLRRLNGEGKPMAWPGVGKPDVDAHVGMCIGPHTLGVRPADGRPFLFESPMNDPAHGRSCKKLSEFGLDGKRAEGDPLIWKVSEAVVGPKFDQEGNIYVVDQVKPVDQPYPKEFEPLIGKLEIGKKVGGLRSLHGLYGSVVKFSPKGGMIDWDHPGSNMSDGLPKPAKLDPALKTVSAVTSQGHGESGLLAARVTGAEWMHMGASHADLIYCNCETIRFDVDEFGRVFYPDTQRFRVGVLDTAGNEILHFGGYGNAESMGPDSPVVDPQSKRLRPRKADDPKELKSPFAEPEIALSWLVGVGVTDRYAYMGDSMNRRLLRAKLDYAAEESCEVR